MEFRAFNVLSIFKILLLLYETQNSRKSAKANKQSDCAHRISICKSNGSEEKMTRLREIQKKISEFKILVLWSITLHP